MKRIHLGSVRRGESDVNAGRSAILLGEPELRPSRGTERDGAGHFIPLDAQAEGRQRGCVKRTRFGEIADVEADVVEHASSGLRHRLLEQFTTNGLNLRGLLHRGTRGGGPVHQLTPPAERGVNPFQKSLIDDAMIGEFRR